MGFAQVLGAHRRTLAGIVLVCSVTNAAEAGSQPTKWHRDPVHKFAIRVFPDWEPVPIEPGHPYEVLKYHDPVDKGMGFRPDLTVVRLVKDPVAAPVTGSGADPRAEAMRRMLSGKDAWDVTVDHLMVAEGAAKPDKKKFKSVKSADDVAGKLWVHEVPQYDGKPEHTAFVTLASFEQDGIEYGLYMTCSARQKGSYDREFITMARSFSFFDEHARDVESLDVLADVNLSAKRRAEIEASMVKGWDVLVSPKKNYVVIYNTNENKNRELAKVIAERIEKIREQIYEVQFPPAQPIDAVSIVRVCASRTEYFTYGGAGGSAGYWNSGTEELVFYDASPSKKIDDDTVAVLYHEAFHQYIYYSVGEVSPHSWFNEGHGDYYAGCEYQRGRFKVEPFRWRIGIVKEAIRQGPRPFQMVPDEKTQQEQKVWQEIGYTPLADLVRFSQRDYYAYPGVSYAQGWSLIYFLREEVPKRKAYQEKWGHILDTYFDTLKAEANPTPPAEPVAKGPGDTPGDTPGGGTNGGGAGPGDGEGDEEEGDEVNPGSAAPPPITRSDNEAARARAVEKAFAGVDFAELEKAWIEATLKVSG